MMKDMHIEIIERSKGTVDLMLEYHTEDDHVLYSTWLGDS
jgi:hypothetical protein